MKQLHQWLAAAAVFTLFTCSQCNKKNEEAQLPAETQTGAETFGCLVNGEVFLPKGNPLAGPIQTAQYQFVNGRQGFGISGSSKQSDGSIKITGITGDSVILSVRAFDLTKFNVRGKLWGGYSEISFSNSGIDYYTNEINRGQLVIKKFDTANQIVSGTFWFDAVNSGGTVVQVREGRFDMRYVR